MWQPLRHKQTNGAAWCKQTKQTSQATLAAAIRSQNELVNEPSNGTINHLKQTVKSNLSTLLVLLFVAVLLLATDLEVAMQAERAALAPAADAN